MKKIVLRDYKRCKYYPVAAYWNGGKCVDVFQNVDFAKRVMRRTFGRCVFVDKRKEARRNAD